MRRASLFSWKFSWHLWLKMQIYCGHRVELRSGMGKGQRWFLYFVLIRLRYSRSTPRPFPSHSSAFFQFYLFLFRDGFCRRSSVLVSSFGGLVAPSAGTASSLSSQFVLPTSVTIPCLVPSPCVFACMGLAVCLVRLTSNSVISASMVITSWGSVQVVKSTGFASSSWGVTSCLRWCVGYCCSPQYPAGRLWAQVVNIRGKSRCLVMRCALGDHLNSSVNSAVPVVDAFSRDMSPCIGVESDVTIPPPCLLGHV